MLSIGKIKMGSVLLRTCTKKNNYKTLRNEKNIIYILKNGFNNNIIENAIHWEKKEMGSVLLPNSD